MKHAVHIEAIYAHSSGLLVWGLTAQQKGLKRQVGPCTNAKGW